MQGYRLKGAEQDVAFFLALGCALLLLFAYTELSLYRVGYWLLMTVVIFEYEWKCIPTRPISFFAFHFISGDLFYIFTFGYCCGQEFHDNV